jgi:hypothetical protein
MPDVRSTSLFDKGHCPFGQALDYVIHRNIAEVREAPPPLSQREWTSETFDACRRLCLALEIGTVRSIDDPHTLHLVRWSNTKKALDDFRACPDAGRRARFIAIIERVTSTVRVRVVDLVKTFPPPELLALEPPAPVERLALGPPTSKPPPPIETPAPESPPPKTPAPPVTPASALSATESGRRGGKRSGEVRRESRRWVPHAEELALAVDPHLSNEAIATEISGSWKSQDVDPPGTRTLVGFVAELRTDGKLPQRERRSRS